MKNDSKFYYAITLPLTVIAMALFSCNNEPDPVIPESNIVEIVAANSNFTTLEAAVQSAGLAETLSSAGPFTVFAPTNDAFASYLNDNNLTTDQLLASDDLQSVLTYHVVSSEIPASAVAAGRVGAVSGSPFFVSIAPDQSIWINGSARVIQSDINASNGVIHVLDYMIVPPTQSIADIAVASSQSATPEFTQLVAALQRADLVSVISGDINDNLTVFAPTDVAFQELYTALGVNNVNEIPLETLTNVLRYHVVPERVFSQDLRHNATLPTLLEGASLMVDLDNLQINDAGLVETALNIHATNGVIHVIDSVIVPE